MFSSEEMEAILNPMKEIAAQQGYSGSLFSFYADRNLFISPEIILLFNHLLVSR